MRVRAAPHTSSSFATSISLPLVFGEFHSRTRPRQGRGQQRLARAHFSHVAWKGLVAQHHITGKQALPERVPVEARVVRLVGSIPYFYGGDAGVIA